MGSRKGEVRGYDRTGRRVYLQNYMCDDKKSAPSGALVGKIKEIYKGKSWSTEIIGSRSSLKG